MKLNLNTHDIFALVTEFQNLVGSQVVNVYDINPKTICIKLRCKISNSQQLEENKNEIEEEKNVDQKKHVLKYLLIESSTKFYLLNDFKAVNDAPSSFSSKLRKHINGKRIDLFRQLNCDRVIDIKFGTDYHEKNYYSFHLICEFYASGNIILTDHNYLIMTLIHPFTYKAEDSKLSIDEDIKVKVGNIYPFDIATTSVSLTNESIIESMKDEIKNIGKKIKLKQFMMKLPLIMYSPNVLEHILFKVGLSPNTKIDSDTNIENIFTNEIINNCISEINELFNLKTFNGYTIDNSFVPFLYEQYQKENITKYNTFSDAVTTHFSNIDKFETKEVKIEKEKNEKISRQKKVLQNINQQIDGLKEKTQKTELMIENIELDVERLQEFMEFVVENVYTKCLPQDVKFDNLQLLEYKKHLNQIKFIFNEVEYTWDTKISAYANLNSSFKNMKQTKEKIKKAESALDIAEKNNRKRSDDNNNVLPNIQLKDKKDHWFEQFNWFITSDGLLFVSGKTSNQNEIIVKKYLNDNDLYFHSDVFGSGSGVLKNNGRIKLEEYGKSIEEAGNFLICHTKAWKDNSPDKSYWVYKDQVSKTPETGEYNVKGAFIIRGTKNYVNANKMELGLGILFKTIDKEELQTECKDNIEYAVPVVGTYGSLSKFKFKVKIIPGTQKIKKVFPDVLSTFYKISNQYEKIGIKKISNNDFQRVLVNNVKFVL